MGLCLFLAVRCSKGVRLRERKVRSFPTSIPPMRPPRNFNSQAPFQLPLSPGEASPSPWQLELSPIAAKDWWSRALCPLLLRRQHGGPGRRWLRGLNYRICSCWSSDDGLFGFVRFASEFQGAPWRPLFTGRR